jgi:uncharacterized membrane protein YgcG
MITIQDPGSTLSTYQTDALIAKAAAYPFDIHVLIGVGGSSRAAFEREVSSFVAPDSRTVSIGVNPLHHFTFVHSSAALGVPPGPQVAQAGNVFFKSGNLVDGIDAIAAKANQLRVEPVAQRNFVATPDQRVIESQTGVPIVIQENHTAAGVWWGLAAFVLASGLVVGFVVRRARKARQAAREAQEALTIEAAELAALNVEERDWHDAMARTKRSAPPRVAYSTAPAFPAAPTPAPVVVQQQNSGLDLLIGYELGRSREPRIVERETIIERAPSPPYESSSSDSSSSSSWSSSDSSSSSDWSSSSDSSSSSSFDSGSSSGSDW